jgi:ABC-type uncharacterized transport system ATPase subunit
MAVCLELKNICKYFGNFVANDNINFELEKGEIHVLLGENGAGKTTLMNILYGLLQPDNGKIIINGKETKITNPNIAISNGIGMVHQHFMQVGVFSVTENIILGTEPRKGISLDMNKARKNVEEISRKYGLLVDPDAKIEDISVGMQQRVEILKALYRGAEILILDEPTAVLTPQEIDELGAILDKLTEQGKSIILITHKLKEVMSMSDRVTIIRRGKIIDTIQTNTTNKDELAEKMVGRKVNLTVEKTPSEPGKSILKVTSLNANDARGLEAVKDINLEVRAGEILAVAGVDGNGQNELVECLTGLQKCSSGKIEIDGQDITGKSPKDVFESGVGHIPADRHKRGLVLPYTLNENAILGKHFKKPFSNKGFFNFKAIKEYTKELIEQFDVRTSSQEAPAKSLSGGNQQKLIIAREVTRHPKLIIAVQPTRGLDVGAIEFVHKKLIEERDNGKAVLLISLELDEVLALADRIAVIYNGKIVDVLDRQNADERLLGLLMAGGSKDDYNQQNKSGEAGI